MSLWNITTENPISAPKWYARHCEFGAEAVVEGKIDLKDANTTFADGDAVLYAAESPLGGLTSGEVYYVKRDMQAITSSIELCAEKGGEPVVVSAVEGVHTLVKCDTYETTEDGVMQYAVIPVTRADAASKKYGQVFSMPGWWRYRRFSLAGEAEPTVHAELLVSIKGDFFLESEEISEDIDSPEEPVMLNTLSVDASTAPRKVSGKSVSINELNASDVKSIDIKATDGDITVLGGELWASPVTAVASEQ